MGNIASSGIGAGAPSPGSPPALYDIGTEVVVASRPPLELRHEAGDYGDDPTPAKWSFRCQTDATLAWHPPIRWSKSADPVMGWPYRDRDGEETLIVFHEDADYQKGDVIRIYEGSHGDAARREMGLAHDEMWVLNVSGYTFFLPFVDLRSAV